MSESRPPSIFFQYYHQPPFFDLASNYTGDPVDVIIPIIHSNEFWRTNLLSFYKEIPINRLLIGDGGCIDNSLEVVREFPRVEVLDHRSFKSLGYSIAKLIEAVKTPWFIYLHSDVFLPPGWFDEMKKHQSQYDWYECRQHITVLADYPLDYHGFNRPYSGSQMGRREAFKDVTKKIEDDYLYRSEDIVLADLITRNGYRYGRVDSAFHFHQVMYKQSAWQRLIKSVDIQVDRSPEEEFREFHSQLYGLIKYTEPDPYRIYAVRSNIEQLKRINRLDLKEVKTFAEGNNRVWLPYLKQTPEWKRIVLRTASRMYQWFLK